MDAATGLTIKTLGGRRRRETWGATNAAQRRNKMDVVLWEDD